MILKGSQRGGAIQLASHLLKAENEHVEIHEMRGFISDDLHGAFNEAHAIAKGTKMPAIPVLAEPQPASFRAGLDSGL